MPLTLWRMPTCFIFISSVFGFLNNHYCSSQNWQWKDWLKKEAERVCLRCTLTMKLTSDSVCGTVKTSHLHIWNGINGVYASGKHPPVSSPPGINLLLPTTLAYPSLRMPLTYFPSLQKSNNSEVWELGNKTDLSWNSLEYPVSHSHLYL